MGELRVIITVAGLSPDHGGPSRSVVALATELARLGVCVEVVACEQSPGQRPPLLPPSELVKSHLLPATCRMTQWHALAIGFFQLIQRLADGAAPTVLHDTGLWLPNNHACASAARRLRLPLVISPRGMLAEWSLKYRGFKKRLAWILYQRRDLAAARLLHATSQREAKEFRSLGLTQPIAVIPNGVELPDNGDGHRPPLQIAVMPNGVGLPNHPRSLPTTPQPGMSRSSAGERAVLFLARLHPKKGLLDLVDAWASLKPSGWRVVLAGGDDAGHRAEVEAAVRDRGLTSHFDFIGEVADEEKWDLYHKANLFVLPSKSENFGLVITEAMACGVPVITTRGTPWSELVEHRCGWWVDVGAEPLTQALREAIALTDEERHEMGARGRSLVESKYTWPRAAEQMKSAYEWLLGLGPKPAFII